MDGGNHTRAVYATPIRHPSRWGNGWSYEYFHQATQMRGLLLLTHSITLLNVGSIPSPREEWPESTALIWTLVRGQNSAAWHPANEALGLYLILRCTSITGLTTCTSWYLDSNRAAARTILRERDVVYQADLARARQGCRCMTCDAVWLRSGWICPWARFELGPL